MKYIHIAILLVIVSSKSNGQPTDATRANEEERINNVLIDFTNAWNKHDAKAFSNVFSEDADFTNVAGKSASGRSEIEKHHAPSFATKWKDSNQKITKSKIRFIKPDVAAVDAWWELSGIKGPEGQDMPPRKGLLNFIMTKDDNNWYITVMHNMDLREPQ
jgi:uncharacterized protein (TIGR02246 family)